MPVPKVAPTEIMTSWVTPSERLSEPRPALLAASLAIASMDLRRRSCLPSGVWPYCSGVLLLLT